MQHNQASQRKINISHVINYEADMITGKKIYKKFLDKRVEKPGDIVIIFLQLRRKYFNRELQRNMKIKTH